MVTTSAKQIMIVTGEASGDLHGANLIDAVTRLSPETRFFGVGGRRMSDAGCEILIPGAELAVMGIVEVVSQFPVLWRSFQHLKGILKGPRKPDALVLIDFPDFNLQLAKHAKRAGVPVLYYVSPQVWAWRRGRVKTIASVVDSLAAIFPFEPSYYEGLNLLVKYVGHPLLDEFAQNYTRDNLRQQLSISAERKVIGLFPGSRRNELHSMLETLVAAANLIRDRYPNVHFLVPIADTLTTAEVAAKFTEGLPVSFLESGQASIYAIASSCDTVLSVSGTVTLQVALSETPMAIFYKLSPLSYAIGKRLVSVKHFGLPNIVAQEQVVPEFLQELATSEALAEEALHVLNDSSYAEAMRDGLRRMKSKLGEPGCSTRVAEMLLAMLR
jgi:lipid-A-disaccharide synthase